MTVYFDVHFWPNSGRVVLVNAVPGAHPMVTDVAVSSEFSESATFVIALALAEAGDPSGELFEHSRDGSVRQIEVALSGFSVARKIMPL